MKKFISVASFILLLAFSSAVFGQISITKYDSIYIADYLTCSMVSIGDMEHDGQQEIVAIYGVQTSNPGISNYYLRISKVNADGISSMEYILDCHSTIQNFVILDANNDNLEDIAYVFSDSVNIIFQNPGFDFNYNNHLTLFSGFSTDGIAKGDFNQDGKDDFVCSNWNSDHLTIFVQSDMGFYAYDNVSAIQAGYNQIKVWDVNSDGWDDIIFMAGQGLSSGIYVYLNNNGFFYTAPLYFPILGSMGNTLITSSVSFGDFLGTGKGLMINSVYGQPNENTRFIQYQNGNWVNMGLENMLSCYPSAASADFDNNERDETVYLNPSSSNLRVLEFFTLSSNQSLNFTTIGGNYHAYDQMLSTGDIVGNDGKIDFVMISDWGQILIFANAGTTTEVTEPKSDSKITIYPNPSTDYLTVSFNQSGEYNVFISDLSGRIVLEKKYSGQQFTIDVKSFHPGMYSLRILGKESFSKKFIVQ
ncbi:MAG: T9SS type A sorting domain-containing protein [bacterium]